MYSFSNNIKKSPKTSTIWFLLQRLRLKDPASEPEYFIISTDDLPQGRTSNIQAKKFIPFIYKGEFIQAKVMYSSSAKESVEKELQKLNIPVPCKTVPKPEPRYFLLEYSKNPFNVTQLLVDDKEILLHMPMQGNQREVVIFDGHQERLANVLFMHKDKDYIELEFKKLKQFSFDMAKMITNQEINSIHGNDYMLMLSANGPFKASYSIVSNSSGAVGEKDKEFYITDGCSVNKCLIIHRASNIDTLINQLNIMKDSCCYLEFPLEVDLNRSRAMPPLSDETETNEKLVYLYPFNI